MYYKTHISKIITKIYDKIKHVITYIPKVLHISKNMTKQEVEKIGV